MIGSSLSIVRRVARLMLLTMLFGGFFTFSRALVSTTIGSAERPDSPAITAFVETYSAQLADYKDSITRVFGFSDQNQRVRVTRVIDGDTFEARAGRDLLRVRIIGVDTPELSSNQCFASQAHAYTKRRLERSLVTLQFGDDRTDKYGRTLAYVDLDGHDFGRSLLSRGYARTLEIAPNTDRASRYRASKLAAKRASRGFWGAC